MKIINKIIKAHDRSGVIVYNQMRLTLTLLGPGFILAGLLGLLGSDEVRSSGEVVEGMERIMIEIIFIVLGFLFIYLRLTIFKNKRDT